MRPFHWFKGASVRELYDRLTEAGPDTARLEVYQEGTAMTLRVVPADDIGTESHTDDHINDSHLCPPDCG